ncbi:glycine cleavage system protein R [Inmirania thermothiophila]|uniref:Glycine cleavage system transcriptional repressor n=1 Tax=Inmirania thermothiophila TaxID=1750597 RepID=A0A3N1YBD2_9GAMM|nr:ACT domain-containing protein [Inmirania thermothiophila]ROR34707.1 glycine cleavage system transcriptional repressor [Inmirania thermothiophila]
MSWYMVTLVGEDRQGIVARVSGALYEAGCNLGEASMMRLGGNFAVMLMVEQAGPEGALEAVLAPVARALGLHLHVDPIRGRLHEHAVPDVRITIAGADRTGIVAQATQALAEAGLNILDLESDVAGTPDRPIYVLHIEGEARRGIEALRRALAGAGLGDLDVRVEPVETLVG